MPFKSPVRLYRIAMPALGTLLTGVFVMAIVPQMIVQQPPFHPLPDQFTIPLPLAPMPTSHTETRKVRFYTNTSTPPEKPTPSLSADQYKLHT